MLLENKYPKGGFGLCQQIGTTLKFWKKTLLGKRAGLYIGILKEEADPAKT
jgi:hypothetical protein